MDAFPHCYSVVATAHAEGDVTLTADRLSALRSASPAEFDGPGDQWSPETFLVGAVADCFILAFRAVATASKLPWTSLRCVAVGTLDRVDRVTQFTNVTLRAHLSIPAGTQPDRARQALKKAERTCLISNSLKATTQVETEIELDTDNVEDAACPYAGAWD